MNSFISIRVIMDDLLSHPLLADLSFERVLNYTYHFMRIVGIPDIFNEKVEKVKIEDYRGVLPCDLYRIIQVKDSETGVCYRASTDSFFHSDNKPEMLDLSYKVQGGVIYTSKKEGEAEIAYKAMQMDDEGYPMIPDNSSFIRALESYIKREMFKVLMETGKLNAAVFEYADREYKFDVAQAGTSLLMPTYDEMQSFTNMWNTLVPRVTEHDHGFRNLGTREYLKNH